MRESSACGSAPTAKTDHASRRRSTAVIARRRSTLVVARRRSARVSRGPVTTIEERYRAEEGAPHILSEPPHRRRYRGVVAESSLRSVRDVYLRLFRRGFGPRDTRSKRRLADATVGSRAGAWTRWYPSREARLRPRSWTSRALLAKGCLDDSAIPRLSGVLRQARAGHPLQPCNALDRGARLGDTPRPHVGEHHRRGRRGEQPPRPRVGEHERDRRRFTRSGSRHARSRLRRTEPGRASPRPRPDAEHATTPRRRWPRRASTQ